MELILNDIIRATKKLKKLLREHKKQVNIIEDFVQQVLLQQKSVFVPPEEKLQELDGVVINEIVEHGGESNLEEIPTVL